MELKRAQRLSGSLKYFVGLGLVLFCCLGCAGSGTVGKSPVSKPEMNVQGQDAPPPQPALASPEAKDHLLSVSAQEQGGTINVTLTADAPFKDYQFRRLGPDRFAIELPTINGRGELPMLPDEGDRMRLAYEDLPGSGIQLTGSLEATLDRYVLNSSQNALYVTLHVENQPVAGTRKSSDSRQLPPSPIKVSSGAKKGGGDQPRALTQAKPFQGPDSPSAGAVQPTQGEDSSFTGVMQRAKYSGKPISLDLLDADLKNVLRLLADLSGTNIVIEPQVTGKVTLKVEQVPWDQVLDMVLAMNELGKERIGNVIRIAAQGKLKDEWSQKTSEIKARQDLLEAAKDLGEITTAYLSVNYAQPADIAAKIAESRSEKGRISVDERTSLIIYSDFPARIEAARQLLARLDKATPQVLIEARIVTASTDVTKSLGINWNLRTSHDPGGNTLNQNFEVNNIGDIFGFSLAQMVGETLVRVDFQLSALEVMNEVKIMAAPRVLTINNTKAVITQGTQIPYRKSNEFGVISTEFKDATLELQVIPHITPDRKVRLEIKAKQDEPTVQTFEVGGDNAVGIDTRKIETELLVDDGSILVIGGVIRNRDSLARDATPGLHQIPILGRLFKSETAASVRTELLIFISPKIVETPMIPMQG